MKKISEEQIFIYTSCFFNYKYSLCFDIEFNIVSNIEESLIRFAKVSSIGDMPLNKIKSLGVESYCSKIFKISRIKSKIAQIRIAYPVELFENDNISSILSKIKEAVNKIENIQKYVINDINIPENMFKVYLGPKYGEKYLKDKFKVYDRKLKCFFIENRPDLSPNLYSLYIDSKWKDNDIVFDSISLADPIYNPFYERINHVINQRRGLSDIKDYFPNITARFSEMYARAKYFRDMGGRGIIVDLFSIGFSGFQFLANSDFELIISCFIDQSDFQFLSIKTLIKLMRLLRADIIFIKLNSNKIPQEILTKQGSEEFGNIKKSLIYFI